MWSDTSSRDGRYYTKGNCNELLRATRDNTTYFCTVHLAHSRASVIPRCVVLAQEMTWSEIIEMPFSIERWHPILPESKEHTVVAVFAIRTSLWSLLVKLATDKIASRVSPKLCNDQIHNSPTLLYPPFLS
jgi:hypothetical protein